MDQLDLQRTFLNFSMLEHSTAQSLENIPELILKSSTLCIIIIFIFIVINFLKLTKIYISLFHFFGCSVFFDKKKRITLTALALFKFFKFRICYKM